MAGKLYLVGTPIGNLGDLSKRAADTLSNVDFIAAEDTRVTVKLLNHLGIKKPMLSYYEHNKRERGGEIIERILSGQSCAIVTDAGMPAISDPGEDMVRLAHENGIKVESVPGPSAVVTALAMSGMPSGRFTFEGFLTMNKPGRRAHLSEIKNEKRTMIFYEAPHKLLATLSDMLSIFGDREIALVRELTKIHEEVIRTTLSDAVKKYTETAPKGEFVLIVSGAKEEARLYTLEEAINLAKEFCAKGQSASSAAKMAAEITNIKKGDIYKGMN
ncbi:MAG: 16S rRNA (cytidine(1402)-2'-O)-methyltransferase [Acutalibacteraceae bacterium]|nr:16S rRNA (cytidine(1402)-2'-O)-methyltransferase [Acutalibacteraceae bacterium]